jgi:hypothetical protein
MTTLANTTSEQNYIVCNLYDIENSLMTVEFNETNELNKASKFTSLDEASKFMIELSVKTNTPINHYFVDIEANHTHMI